MQPEHNDFSYRCSIVTPRSPAATRIAGTPIFLDFSRLRGRSRQTGPVLATLFLLLGVAFLVLTVNSFRPVRHNRFLFVPSFFVSWLTNELAGVYLAVMAAIVALFVGPGDVLDSVAGWVGLACMALTALLLGAVYLAGLRTGPVVVKALGGFGRELHPERARRRAITRNRNVPYRRVAGKTLRLDVTMPVEPPASGTRRPALVQIHGGGWVIGDKREQGLPLIKRMASNGWVCFNVNYRLSPGATWPDALVDCKAAVAWVREHADEYGIDPSFVAVTGGSAGGHLSALVGLTGHDRTLQPGFEDADCTVQAAVPFYGIYDFTNRLGTQGPEMRRWLLEPLVMKRFFDEEPEAFAAASPIDRIHQAAPPFLVIHGDLDTLAPVEDARAFVEHLAEVSDSPVFYAELPGAQHAFELFTSPRARRALDGVQRFLFECYARHIAARTPATKEEAAAAIEPEIVEPSAVS
jgi:acetyl esterase/lipase